MPINTIRSEIIFALMATPQSFDVTLCKSSRFQVYVRTKSMKSITMCRPPLENRMRPNFFVGVKLDGLNNEVEAIQSKIQNQAYKKWNIDLSNTFTSSKKMHFTAFVMSLSDKNKISEAVSVLSEVKLEHPVIIKLTKIKVIDQRVLYIAPDEEDPGFLYLKDTVRHIFGKFQEKGLVQPQYTGVSPEKWIDGWLPHATIAKTSADRKNGRKIKFNKELILEFESTFDGIQVPLTRVDMLEMAKIDDAGYYKSHATITFPNI